MKHTTFADYERRLQRAERLIEARLDEPLAPEEIAAAAHFSLHHFHRIFRAQRGESVMQHVRRLRLERAARLIRSSGVRLLDVALTAGYESHEAFTRAFVERFGTTPSLYRRTQGARAMTWEKPTQRPPASVRVQTFPAVPVLCMRSYGSYAAVGATWQKLLAWISTRRAPMPPLYGLCPDDPDVTDEARLRFDACVVAEGLHADEHVTPAILPAGTYAVAVHVGPYHRLHETYLDVIGHWFPSSGVEPAPEPVIEHYRNDPACTPESELQTEVRVRIAE